MKKILYYSFAFVLLLSCKKEKDLPQPEITEPHFYVTCNVDGQLLNIQAGNEDYYMNSSWYRNDSNSIFVYKANLAKQIGSGYQVTILFNDFRPTGANATMKADSALWKGDHLFDDKNISGSTQNITFKPLKQSVLSEIYSWTVTDGISPKTYPGDPDGENYSISSQYDVGKTYTVTLDYNDGTGVCGAVHTNVFKAGSPLQTHIVVERDQTSPELKYKFSYPLDSYNNIKCSWEFPNGDMDSAPSPTRIFQQQDTYPIKLNISNTITGDSCTSYYQLNATNGKACDANFTADFQPVRNGRLYSSVTVLLTDPNGVVYSSGSLVQPKTSNFQIMDVADYSANEKGESTKRVRVKFNCVVKNGNKEINLSNGEAKVAVSYKK